MDAESSALSNILVVDLTHILAGPYCTMLLADAGANVIKIEPPGGEYARIRGVRRVAADGSTISAYSAAVNRGKRSIELDLKSEAGLQVAKQLIAKADVVVENFAPGAIARLGLDFTELRKQFPRLITSSISLFGQDPGVHEFRTRGGIALIAEAEAGLTSLNRTEAGVPMPLQVPLGDIAAGMAAYAGIVTALLERSVTGVGRHLDISMVRALLSFSSTRIASVDIDPLFEINSYHPAGSGIFPTLDGFVAIGVNTDSLWARLAHCMGQRHLSEDPRYAGYTERDSRIPEVNDLVAAWTSTMSTSEVIDRLSPVGLPCGRVNTTGNVISGYIADQLHMITQVDDGLGGHVHVPANPMGIIPKNTIIPGCGEHADQILGLAENL